MTKTYYSLWFKPDGDVAARLQKVIDELAEEYHGPHFAPHVTLIGGIEGTEEQVIAKTKKLADSFTPFPINFADIAYQDAYFRSLFILAKNDSTLINIHRIATREHDLEETNFYMPHLSLLYGNYADELKEKIIQRIRSHIPTQFLVDRLYIIQYKEGTDISGWDIVSELPLAK